MVTQTTGLNFAAFELLLEPFNTVISFKSGPGKRGRPPTLPHGHQLLGKSELFQSLFLVYPVVVVVGGKYTSARSCVPVMVVVVVGVHSCIALGQLLTFYGSTRDDNCVDYSNVGMLQHAETLPRPTLQATPE